MLVHAFIPYWSKYKPLKSSMPNKEFVEIGGKSLFNRTLEILNNVSNISKTYIFSNNFDSKFINSKFNVEILNRNENLDDSEVSIEQIIDEFLKTSNAEIIVLAHPRSPFLKAQTINECIENIDKKNYDSALIVRKIQRHSWFKNKPLNYQIHSDTPSLRDIDPIFIESGSIYIFKRDLYIKNRSRIGDNPYFKEVGHFEGFEIDDEDDLSMAEIIINSGLDVEKSK